MPSRLWQLVDEPLVNQHFESIEQIEDILGDILIGNDASSLLINSSSLASNAGNISLNSSQGNIDLTNSNLYSTSNGENGIAGNVNITANSTISLINTNLDAAAFGSNGRSGNIKINADFVVAFPNQNNDILTTAKEGDGGKIDITVESLLGIDERPLNSFTNDINASSEFGLNGRILINTLEINSLQETIDLVDKIVSANIVAAFDACSISETGEASGLVVKGKGGVTPEPTEPISAEVLILEEENTSNQSPNDNSQLNPEEIPSHIQPVAYKNNGEPIYLARGVILQEDGTLILTAYETENSNPRSASKSYGCN